MWNKELNWIELNWIKGRAEWEQQLRFFSNTFSRKFTAIGKWIFPPLSTFKSAPCQSRIRNIIIESSSFLLVLFQDCSFNKLKSDTALKVSYQGNVRMHSDQKCIRLYFKFNGNECSGPMTIEAGVYSDWAGGIPNLHHHRSFEGYCENISKGTVRVELWVGQCSSFSLGNAYTGWIFVSRIMIEEVSRPQS